MEPKQINRLIVTITFCFTWIIWGTIVVARQVNDVNYHAPTQKEKYVDCINQVTADSYKIVNDNCAKIAGIKS